MIRTHRLYSCCANVFVIGTAGVVQTLTTDFHIDLQPNQSLADGKLRQIRYSLSIHNGLMNNLRLGWELPSSLTVALSVSNRYAVSSAWGTVLC